MKVLYVSALIFILDQFTKWLTKVHMNLRESIEVVGDFVQLTYIQNAGMAFGLNIPNKVVFNVLSVTAAAAIFYYLFRYRSEKIFPRMALAVIFGGAVGNLFDRFLYGSVVDFIDVDIPDIRIPELQAGWFTLPAYSLSRWPIFNVADMAVSIGMFLLVFSIVSSEHPWYLKKSAGENVPAHEPEQTT